IFEDRLIGSIGANIEHYAPGLFDYHTNLLLSGFLDEMQSLKESARFFYEALDVSLNRDKGAFFAFLASLELDYVHRRLQTETDPDAIAAGNPQYTDSDIRSAINRALDAIFQTINEDERRIMYRNARSLQCLKELASFLFDRFAAAFSNNSQVRQMAAPAYLVVDQLSLLNNILYSLQDPPSMPLFETLFVFMLQERGQNRGPDLPEELKSLLSKAEESLGRIRQFNKRVPLTAIIRCANRNLGYMPQAISGGEDWFVVYRDYWKKQVDEKYSRYLQQKRRKELSETLRDFLKGVPLKPLQYALSDTNPEGLPIRHSFSLSFLAAFYSVLFVEEINKVLKPILIDGEFYKRENRSEFTEAYNELLKLGDAIRRFDQKLSPTGDIGKRYDLARQEITSLAIKRRKLQALELEINDEAFSLLEGASRALKSLVAVLGGILRGEAGGKYDSLVNLGSLAGRNTAYMKILQSTQYTLEKALKLLDEIALIEAGR
ncbi:MAG: DUF5312 family protein, partial [Termitinemataceae bacterium]